MMYNQEIFSEVYGCYFTVVSRILEKAQTGMSKAEIEKLVNDNAFYDSAFHLLPKLFSVEWNLLEKKTDDRYYSKLLSANTERPMTHLEKSWIKALLLDKRISLFVSQNELLALESLLADVSPLYFPEDFYTIDSASDGDPYNDENYIRNFRTILQSCAEKTLLIIDYEGGKRRRVSKIVLPLKLNYSSRDDKFRIHGITKQKDGIYKGITLNLARIQAVQISDWCIPNDFDPHKYLEDTISTEPIVLEISKERNALERCMLQFATWEKQTEFDEVENHYICKIFYNGQDETELLIRILSFGPVVRVLGPERFLNQVKERIFKQFNLGAIV